MVCAFPRGAWLVLAAAACVCAAHAAKASTPELSIRVQPRIGLFDRYLYARERPGDTRPAHARNQDKAVAEQVTAQWLPRGVSDYWQAIDPGLRSTLPTGVRFEMLHGNAPNIGYAVRTAVVALKAGTAGALSQCRLTVDGREAGAPSPAEPCSWTLSIDNAAKRVRVAALLDGRAVAADGVIPEDFLIVVLGDSFASGEGNPDGRTGNHDGSRACDSEVGWGVADVVKAQDRAPSCTPLWMDARCHRSMWSGPIQAALRTMRGPREDGLGRDGAWTVLSLACSGATIDKGLVGEYPDTPRTVWDLRREYQSLGLKPPDPKIPVALRGEDPQPAQLETLEKTLGQDHGGKRHIDVLSIGIGGNDIGFSAVVQDLFSNNLGQAQFSAVRTSKQERIQRLRGDRFSKLAERLQKLDIRQVLLTEYPDPTRLASGADPLAQDDCADKQPNTARLYCGGPVAAGFAAQPLTELLSKKLDATESRFVHCSIVRPLGAALSDVAKNQGWRFVSGIADAFAGHGWCGSSAPSAYGQQQRWFRRLDESWAFQGNASGTVHPTWEGHAQAIAPAIATAIQDGQHQVLTVALANPVATRNGTSHVAPPLLLRVLGRDGQVESQHAGCLTTPDAAGQCVPCFVGSTGPAHCAVAGRIDATGLGDNTVLRVQHAHTRRVFQQALHDLRAAGTQRLVLDQTPPTVQGPDRPTPADSRRCPAGWLSAACDLEVGAQDDGAGVLELHLELRGCASADMPWQGCTALQAPQSWRNVDGQGLTAVPLGAWVAADVRWARIAVSATDAVGNRAASRHYPLRIDRQAPAFHSLTVYGSSPADLAVQRVLPIDRDEPTPFTLVLQESVSGLAQVDLTSSADQALRQLTPLQAADPDGLVATTYDAANLVTGRRLVNVDFSARDQAGNRALLPGLALQPQAAKVGQPALLPADWQAAQQAPELQRCLGRALQLTRNVPDPLPPGDAVAWLQLAAWLNIACGHVRPSQPVVHRISDGCTATPDGPLAQSTLWALLVRAERCAGAPDAAAVQAAASEALAPMSTWQVRPASEEPDAPPKQP